LHIQTADALYPKLPTVNFTFFEATFTIPRLVTNPLPLATPTDYEFLLKNACKMKSDPSVKIIITENQSSEVCPTHYNNPHTNKENHCDSSSDLQGSKKGKGNKTPKEANILPANVALNNKIKELRTHWFCNVGNCHSEHCYIPAERLHFPLGYDHFEKWAAACLRGEEFASIETPPNTTLFNEVSPTSIVAESPILQACLNAMAKEKATLSAPVINVVLPNDIFGLYCPTAPAPLPAQLAPIHQQQHVASSGLIPTHLHPGVKMDMTTFCATYHLSNAILSWFKENAFTGTQAFQYIDNSEIKEMGFKLGEIVDLKEAVEEWVQP
ncbi:hypothetical protein BDQ12DRAFT_611582, partial [Crucibulum laeve]